MSRVHFFMPLLHCLMVSLASIQWLFYLQLDDDRAKFLTLFRKAFSDSANFLTIVLLICVVAGLNLHLMGAKFDDGGNFDEGYDTNFNDYAFVFAAGVDILGILRNAVGDL